MRHEIDVQRPATLPELCAGVLAAIVTASVTAFLTRGCLRLSVTEIPQSFYGWYALIFTLLGLPIAYRVRRRNSPGLGMGMILGIVFVMDPIFLLLQGVVDSRSWQLF